MNCFIEDRNVRKHNRNNNRMYRVFTNFIHYLFFAGPARAGVRLNIRLVLSQIKCIVAQRPTFSVRTGNRALTMLLNGVFGKMSKSSNFKKQGILLFASTRKINNINCGYDRSKIFSLVNQNNILLLHRMPKTSVSNYKKTIIQQSQLILTFLFIGAGFYGT